ncbi:MAG: NAAT family transporter [Alphaproteobacteria bacterium]|nr:NAAT family transporter [Alphaproteobacteria bacterium]
MVEPAIIAFTTFFATVAPMDVAAIYATLTAKATAVRRREMAVKAILVATGILLLMALFGNEALRLLGVTLPALRIAGGILLFLIGLDMVFALHTGGVSTTEAESQEAARREDISVFPMATPLIAGPGAIGAVVLQMAGSSGDVVQQAVIVSMLLLVLVVTWALMLIAGSVSRLLGVTGLNVVQRVMGILLCALAVQYVIDGIAATNLLAGA